MPTPEELKGQQEKKAADFISDAEGSGLPKEAAERNSNIISPEPERIMPEQSAFASFAQPLEQPAQPESAIPSAEDMRARAQKAFSTPTLPTFAEIMKELSGNPGVGSFNREMYGRTFQKMAADPEYSKSLNSIYSLLDGKDRERYITRVGKGVHPLRAYHRGYGNMFLGMFDEAYHSVERWEKWTENPFEQISTHAKQIQSKWGTALVPVVMLIEIGAGTVSGFFTGIYDLARGEADLESLVHVTSMMTSVLTAGGTLAFAAKGLKATSSASKAMKVGQFAKAATKIDDFMVKSGKKSFPFFRGGALGKIENISEIAEIAFFPQEMWAELIGHFGFKGATKALEHFTKKSLGKFTNEDGKFTLQDYVYIINAGEKALDKMIDEVRAIDPDSADVFQKHYTYYKDFKNPTDKLSAYEALWAEMEKRINANYDENNPKPENEEDFVFQALRSAFSDKREGLGIQELETNLKGFADSIRELDPATATSVDEHLERAEATEDTKEKLEILNAARLNVEAYIDNQKQAAGDVPPDETPATQPTVEESDEADDIDPQPRENVEPSHQASTPINTFEPEESQTLEQKREAEVQRYKDKRELYKKHLGEESGLTAKKIGVGAVKGSDEETEIGLDSDMSDGQLAEWINKLESKGSSVLSVVENLRSVDDPVAAENEVDKILESVAPGIADPEDERYVSDPSERANVYKQRVQGFINIGIERRIQDENLDWNNPDHASSIDAIRQSGGYLSTLVHTHIIKRLLKEGLAPDVGGGNVGPFAPPAGSEISSTGIIGYTLDAFEKNHADAISQNENLRQTLEYRRKDIEEGLHKGDLEARRRFVVGKVINGISRFAEAKAFFDDGYANTLLGSVGLELIPVEIGKTAVDARTQEVRGSSNKPNMPNGAVAEVVAHGIRDLETGDIVQKSVVIRVESNNPNATQEVDTTPSQSALDARDKQKDIEAQPEQPPADISDDLVGLTVNAVDQGSAGMYADENGNWEIEDPILTVDETDSSYVVRITDESMDGEGSPALRVFEYPKSETGSTEGAKQRAVDEMRQENASQATLEGPAAPDHIKFDQLIGVYKGWSTEKLQEAAARMEDRGRTHTQSYRAVQHTLETRKRIAGSEPENTEILFNARKSTPDNVNYLSNMANTPFKDPNGYEWKSVEHFYQAHKTKDPKQIAAIAGAKDGFEARRIGNNKSLTNLRSDWELVKNSVMEQALKLKFDGNPELKQQLINTGDANLKHLEDWGNPNSVKYWGVGSGGKGANHLGKMLMDLRSEYRGVVSPTQQQVVEKSPDPGRPDRVLRMNAKALRQDSSSESQAELERRNANLVPGEGEGGIEQRVALENSTNEQLVAWKSKKLKELWNANKSGSTAEADKIINQILWIEYQMNRNRAGELRQKRLKLTQIPHRERENYTFGMIGMNKINTPEALVGALKDAGGDGNVVFVDVRAQPYSSPVRGEKNEPNKYHFRDPRKLEPLLSEAGIRYVQAGKFAPSNATREKQREVDAKTKVQTLDENKKPITVSVADPGQGASARKAPLAQGYTKAYDMDLREKNADLGQFMMDVQEQYGLKKGDVIVFACIEPFAHSCHRSILARMALNDLGVRVIDISAGTAPVVVNPTGYQPDFEEVSDDVLIPPTTARTEVVSPVEYHVSEGSPLRLIDYSEDENSVTVKYSHDSYPGWAFEGTQGRAENSKPFIKIHTPLSDTELTAEMKFERGLALANETRSLLPEYAEKVLDEYAWGLGSESWDRSREGANRSPLTSVSGNIFIPDTSNNANRNTYQVKWARVEGSNNPVPPGGRKGLSQYQPGTYNEETGKPEPGYEEIIRDDEVYVYWFNDASSMQVYTASPHNVLAIRVKGENKVDSTGKITKVAPRIVLPKNFPMSIRLVYDYSSASEETVWDYLSKDSRTVLQNGQVRNSPHTALGDSVSGNMWNGVKAYIQKGHENATPEEGDIAHKYALILRDKMPALSIPEQSFRYLRAAWDTMGIQEEVSRKDVPMSYWKEQVMPFSATQFYEDTGREGEFESAPDNVIDEDNLDNIFFEQDIDDTVDTKEETEKTEYDIYNEEIGDEIPDEAIDYEVSTRRPSQVVSVGQEQNLWFDLPLPLVKGMTMKNFIKNIPDDIRSEMMGTQDPGVNTDPQYWSIQSIQRALLISRERHGTPNISYVPITQGAVYANDASEGAVNRILSGTSARYGGEVGRLYSDGTYVPTADSNKYTVDKKNNRVIQRPPVPLVYYLTGRESGGIPKFRDSYTGVIFAKTGGSEWAAKEPDPNEELSAEWELDGTEEQFSVVGSDGTYVVSSNMFPSTNVVGAVAPEVALAAYYRHHSSLESNQRLPIVLNTMDFTTHGKWIYNFNDSAKQTGAVLHGSDISNVQFHVDIVEGREGYGYRVQTFSGDQVLNTHYTAFADGFMPAGAVLESMLTDSAAVGMLAESMDNAEGEIDRWAKSEVASSNIRDRTRPITEAKTFVTKYKKGDFVSEKEWNDLVERLEGGSYEEGGITFPNVRKAYFDENGSVAIRYFDNVGFAEIDNRLVIDPDTGFPHFPNAERGGGVSVSDEISLTIFKHNNDYVPPTVEGYTPSAESDLVLANNPTEGYYVYRYKGLPGYVMTTHVETNYARLWYAQDPDASYSEIGPAGGWLPLDVPVNPVARGLDDRNLELAENVYPSRFRIDRMKSGVNEGGIADILILEPGRMDAEAPAKTIEYNFESMVYYHQRILKSNYANVGIPKTPDASGNKVIYEINTEQVGDYTIEFTFDGESPRVEVLRDGKPIYVDIPWMEGHPQGWLSIPLESNENISEVKQFPFVVSLLENLEMYFREKDSKPLDMASGEKIKKIPSDGINWDEPTYIHLDYAHLGVKVKEISVPWRVFPRLNVIRAIVGINPASLKTTASDITTGVEDADDIFDVRRLKNAGYGLFDLLYDEYFEGSFRAVKSVFSSKYTNLLNDVDQFLKVFQSEATEEELSRITSKDEWAKLMESGLSEELWTPLDSESRKLFNKQKYALLDKAGIELGLLQRLERHWYENYYNKKKSHKAYILVNANGMELRDPTNIVELAQWFNIPIGALTGVEGGEISQRLEDFTNQAQTGVPGEPDERTSGSPTEKHLKHLQEPDITQKWKGPERRGVNSILELPSNLEGVSEESKLAMIHHLVTSIMSMRDINFSHFTQTGQITKAESASAKMAEYIMKTRINSGMRSVAEGSIPIDFLLEFLGSERKRIGAEGAELTAEDQRLWSHIEGRVREFKATVEGDNEMLTKAEGNESTAYPTNGLVPNGIAVRVPLATTSLTNRYNLGIELVGTPDEGVRDYVTPNNLLRISVARNDGGKYDVNITHLDGMGNMEIKGIRVAPASGRSTIAVDQMTPRVSGIHSSVDSEFASNGIELNDYDLAATIAVQTYSRHVTGKGNDMFRPERVSTSGFWVGMIAGSHPQLATVEGYTQEKRAKAREARDEIRSKDNIISRLRDEAGLEGEELENAANEIIELKSKRDRYRAHYIKSGEYKRNAEYDLEHSQGILAKTDISESERQAQEAHSKGVIKYIRKMEKQLEDIPERLSYITSQFMAIERKHFGIDRVQSAEADRWGRISHFRTMDEKIGTKLMSTTPVPEGQDTEPTQDEIALYNTLSLTPINNKSSSLSVASIQNTEPSKDIVVAAGPQTIEYEGQQVGAMAFFYEQNPYIRINTRSVKTSEGSRVEIEIVPRFSHIIATPGTAPSQDIIISKNVGGSYGSVTAQALYRDPETNELVERGSGVSHTLSSKKLSIELGIGSGFDSSQESIHKLLTQFIDINHIIVDKWLNATDRKFVRIKSTSANMNLVMTPESFPTHKPEEGNEQGALAQFVVYRDPRTVVTQTPLVRINVEAVGDGVYVVGFFDPSTGNSLYDSHPLPENEAEYEKYFADRVNAIRQMAESSHDPAAVESSDILDFITDVGVPDHIKAKWVGGYTTFVSASSAEAARDKAVVQKLASRDKFLSGEPEEHIWTLMHAPIIIETFLGGNIDLDKALEASEAAQRTIIPDGGNLYSLLNMPNRFGISEQGRRLQEIRQKMQHEAEELGEIDISETLRNMGPGSPENDYIGPHDAIFYGKIADTRHPNNATVLSRMRARMLKDKQDNGRVTYSEMAKNFEEIHIDVWGSPPTPAMRDNAISLVIAESLSTYLSSSNQLDGEISGLQSMLVAAKSVDDSTGLKGRSSSMALAVSAIRAAGLTKSDRLTVVGDKGGMIVGAAGNSAGQVDVVSIDDSQRGLMEQSTINVDMNLSDSIPETSSDVLIYAESDPMPVSEILRHVSAGGRLVIVGNTEWHQTLASTLEMVHKYENVTEMGNSETFKGAEHSESVIDMFSEWKDVLSNTSARAAITFNELGALIVIDNASSSGSFDGIAYRYGDFVGISHALDQVRSSRQNITGKSEAEAQRKAIATEEARSVAKESVDSQRIIYPAMPVVRERIIALGTHLRSNEEILPIGKRFTSLAELAALANIGRSPGITYSQVVYLQEVGDGESAVIGGKIGTSRSSVNPKLTPSSFETLGDGRITGSAIVINTPSGDVGINEADVENAKEAASKDPGFKGLIKTDSGIYSCVIPIRDGQRGFRTDALGKVEVVKYENINFGEPESQPESLPESDTEPTPPEGLNNQDGLASQSSLVSPEVIQNISNDFENLKDDTLGQISNLVSGESDWIVLSFVDADGNFAGMVEIPAEAYGLEQKDVEGLLERMNSWYSGNRTFLISRPSEASKFLEGGWGQALQSETSNLSGYYLVGAEEALPVDYAKTWVGQSFKGMPVPKVSHKLFGTNDLTLHEWNNYVNTLSKALYPQNPKPGMNPYDVADAVFKSLFGDNFRDTAITPNHINLTRIGIALAVNKNLPTLNTFAFTRNSDRALSQYRLLSMRTQQLKDNTAFSYVDKALSPSFSYLAHYVSNANAGDKVLILDDGYSPLSVLAIDSPAVTTVGTSSESARSALVDILNISKDSVMDVDPTALTSEFERGGYMNEMRPNIIIADFSNTSWDEFFVRMNEALQTLEDGGRLIVGIKEDSRDMSKYADGGKLLRFPAETLHRMITEGGNTNMDALSTYYTVRGVLSHGSETLLVVDKTAPKGEGVIYGKSGESGVLEDATNEALVVDYADKIRMTRETQPTTEPLIDSEQVEGGFESTPALESRNQELIRLSRQSQTTLPGESDSLAAARQEKQRQRIEEIKEEHSIEFGSRKAREDRAEAQPTVDLSPEEQKESDANTKQNLVVESGNRTETSGANKFEYVPGEERGHRQWINETKEALASLGVGIDISNRNESHKLYEVLSELTDSEKETYLNGFVPGEGWRRFMARLSANTHVKYISVDGEPVVNTNVAELAYKYKMFELMDMEFAPEEDGGIDVEVLGTAYRIQTGKAIPLHGRIINTMREFALAMQAYRHHQFERLIAVFVDKDGVVLRSLPVSSQSNGQVTMTGADLFHIQRIASDEKVAGVRVFHNHPLGVPYFSKTHDVRWNAALKYALGDKYKGQIATNTNTYAEMSPDYNDGLAYNGSGFETVAKTGTKRENIQLTEREIGHAEDIDPLVVPKEERFG